VKSAHASAAAVRLRSRLHLTTATYFLCCGPNGSGYRHLIDRSRVRVPLGALVLR